MRPLRQILVTAWASPWSLLGLAVGLAGMLGRGARVARHGPTLEFSSPSLARFLQRLPNSPTALTLGHVILGRTPVALDVARRHERVHVRQYERWGPLFVPAYLLCSAWVYLGGRDPYWDNPFERQAFQSAGDD